MDKKEEFDLEFDFEKEYGFDPKEILDEDTGTDAAEFDLIPDAAPAEQASDTPLEEDDELDFLSDDFLASLGITSEDISPAQEDVPADDEDAEDAALLSLFDEEPDTEDEIQSQDEEEADAEQAQEDDSYVPAAEPAFDVDSTPDLGEDFAATFDEVAKESESEVDSQEGKTDFASIPQRRRKMSKERIIKEVYLPPIIAGLALVLVLFFVGSAIVRTVKENKAEKDAIAASQEAASSAMNQEANQLLNRAEALAAGYDYEGALATLDTFSGDMTQYKAMVDAYSAYTQAKNQLKPIDDPASIPNLSFHCLIADPSRAFTNETYGISFNNNYVTVDEFSKILQQLYDNNYVLVDFDSFIVETTAEDGTVTYATQPIYLPEGKKPLMLTETLVNYETFSIDSDGDGEADAGGAGFASKLVIGADGKITCEYVDGSGNILTGDYDLVPILNSFLEAHPDFSYRGAKAILAVSGEDGVFGYRIMDSVKKDKGEEYYNQQVEGAKRIAQALRDDGYTIACYTYSNVSYGEYSATQIRADLDAWDREVVPVLGKIDMLIYAKSSDISGAGNYSGNKYNVLKDAGFKYYITAGSAPWTEVYTGYVRQSRIMVTGKQLLTAPTTYASYFDATTVLNNQRGTK